MGGGQAWTGTVPLALLCLLCITLCNGGCDFSLVAIHHPLQWEHPSPQACAGKAPLVPGVPANHSSASQQTVTGLEMDKGQVIANQRSEQVQIFCRDCWEKRSSLLGVLQAGRIVHKSGTIGAILSC